MNWQNQIRRRFQACLFVIVAVLVFGSSMPVMAADSSPPTRKAADPATEAKSKASKPKKKELTGAELYAINCNRCHPERYPTEFTSTQWKTIMTHMRVRANLPAKQAKQILKYLQEDSGS